TAAFRAGKEPAGHTSSIRLGKFCTGVIARSAGDEAIAKCLKCNAGDCFAALSMNRAANQLPIPARGAQKPRAPVRRREHTLSVFAKTPAHPPLRGAKRAFRGCT